MAGMDETLDAGASGARQGVQQLDRTRLQTGEPESILPTLAKVAGDDDATEAGWGVTLVAPVGAAPVGAAPLGAVPIGAAAPGAPLGEEQGSDVTASTLPDSGGVSSLAPADGPADGEARPAEPSAEAMSLTQDRPFRVLDELGRGGMGVVLRARDEDLRRDVAVKLLRGELVRRPDALRRFVEEAQISGQLEHPGIVPIYEMGLAADESPYFVMKLIEGRTLGELLRERRDPGDDLPRFLGIFRQICQTVGYAHSRGVVHRDLKPGNVMVGAFGIVQVVDWGLAKVLGDTRPDVVSSGDSTVPVTTDSTDTGSRSIAGSVVGTPAYMSPEQARGQAGVDARTDVFALGAILCEILTGEPPYAGRQGVTHTLRRASTADLGEAERRLAGAEVPEELRTLALECLSPAKEARPEDAAEVAARIERHLAAGEERARAAELAAAEERVRTIGERRARRLTLALAALVVMGLVGAWYGLDAVERAEREARARATEQAEISYGGAWSLYRRAQNLNAEEALSAWIAAESAAEQLETAATEDIDAPLRERLRALATSISTGAAAARAEAAAVAERREGIEQLLTVRARAAARVGWRAHEEALIEGYEEVFAGRGYDVFAEDEAVRAQVLERLRASSLATELAGALDDWAQAERVLAPEGKRWRRLVALARDVDEDEARDALRGAVLESDPSNLKELAVGLADADVTTWLTLGRALEACGETDGALLALSRARHEHSADFWINFELASISKARPEALAYCVAATAVRPDSPAAWLLLGYEAQATHGDLARAQRAYERALLLKPDEPSAHHNLGTVHEQLGRPDAAALAYGRAIELDPKNAVAHYNLGKIHMERGDHDSAHDLFREAARIAPDDAQAVFNHGASLHRRGELAGAEAEYRRALELNEREHRAATNLGVILGGRGEHAEAEALFRRALEVDPSTVLAWTGLGTSLQMLGRPSEALDVYEDAIDAVPDSGAAALALGRLLSAMGRFDDAIAVYEDLADRLPDPVHVATLASAYHGVGRLEDAIAGYERAIEGKPEFPNYWNNLGIVYRDAGRTEDAVASFEKALELDPALTYAHMMLGHVLETTGDLDRSLDCFRRAAETSPGWAPAEEQYARLTRLVALEGKGEQVLRGELEARASDAYDLMSIAYGLGDEAGTELWFAAHLRLDPAVCVSYDADALADEDSLSWARPAMLAASAAAGNQGTADVAAPDLAAAATLRQAARRWLQPLVDRARAGDAVAQGELRALKSDGAFAPVHDPEALPDAEAAAWRELWSLVR